MDSRQQQSYDRNRRRPPARCRPARFVIAVLAVGAVLHVASPAGAQVVRTKLPDRGSYQSPVLQPVDVEPLDRPSRPPTASTKVVRAAAPAASLAQPAGDEGQPIAAAGWVDSIAAWNAVPILSESTCDGCPDCVDCDAGGCDAGGCDSIGNGGLPWYHGWANGGLSLHRGRWFGSIELLMMFPKGTRVPPLVTTDRDPAADPDDAGELDRADTQILYGDRILDKLQAGGRLTVGTWIDPCCSRSLVFRGWYGGNQEETFDGNQNSFPILTRPILNVTNDPPEQDTVIVAHPDRATGSIAVRATTEFFGGDISARQHWYSRFGGTIDVLYGYQFMRMDERLSISNSSISTDDNFAPVGSLIAIDDRFAVENEFHGGQIGIASRYREGCWSFHSLAKAAFGQLRRSSRLSGSTLTSLDGISAVEPNGLLVRSTNAGDVTDDTFGWVPELDLTIGWHRYPRFDVTMGYHIIAMTDALQVGGVIDPALEVNLSDPLVGTPSPRRRAHYRTFYAQGIHFGLQYVY